MLSRLSKSKEDYAGAWLSPKEGAAIRRLAEKIQGPRAAAVRMAIDAGLKQLDPEY